MPRSSAKRLVVLSAAITGVMAAAGLVGGCDDANSVDRRVRDSIQESRVHRLAGENDQAQQSLQKAADEADAPNATKAHAKALLAQAELDNALARVTDPEKGIGKANREIAVLVYQIGRLGQQVGETNSSVTAFQALEPIDARKLIEAETAAATGGPDKADWVGKPPVAVPTLSAVKQRVASLQDSVAKQQQHIEALQKQQKDVATAASKAAQQAETMTGQQGLQQFKQASDLRKQAADLANQIEVAQAKLAPVQQDLVMAEAQQGAVTKALEQFQQVGQQVETGWKGIEAQIQREQQLAQAILSGSAGDLKTRESIAQKAKQLAEKVAAVSKDYTEAQETLTSSIEHFGQAASAASQLANEIRPRIQDLPADNAMKQTLTTLMAVYNPVVFNLGQANAQLALANLQASRAQTMMERQKVAGALAQQLQDAKLQMPPELSDPKAAEEAKRLVKEADEMYQAAFDNYSTVADSSAADPDKNGGRAGRVYAAYGRALLGRITGNAQAAKTNLELAIGARDAILQDAPTALTALPAELVIAGPATRPATATAPSTAPADAAATPPAAPADGAAPAPAPAPTPPADGAAPAPTPPLDGAAPAPTPPVDGVAPAPTPPVDGAAPPPTPPADGAAPAPTPPADGAAPPPTPPADGAVPAPAPADGAAPAPTDAATPPPPAPAPADGDQQPPPAQ